MKEGTILYLFREMGMFCKLRLVSLNKETKFWKVVEVRRSEYSDISKTISFELHEDDIKEDFSNTFLEAREKFIKQCNRVIEDLKDGIKWQKRHIKRCTEFKEEDL